MSRKSKHRRLEQERGADGGYEKEQKPSAIKWVALVLGVALLGVALAHVMIGALGVKQVSAASAGAQAQLLGSPAPIRNGVQEVTVTMQGYDYQPNPIRLKAGVPARLTVDLATVRGCMRSIQIPELGVAKRVSEGNNMIEFTPQKAGTFSMRCSMGMGQGLVVVEDQNGQVPAASAPAQRAPVQAAAGPGCGMGGGGCGCGG